MTALTRNPLNKDILQTTKFRLVFDRLKGSTFFCQSVNLPGVSLTEIPHQTPFMDLFVPGDKIVWDTFNVSFLIDEDLFAWNQVFDWIHGMTFPEGFDDYANLKNLGASPVKRTSIRPSRVPPQYSDATLSLFTNKNNLNLRVHFVDLFPIYLGPILFNSSDSADTIPSADAIFRFSYYSIERQPKT